MARPSHMSCSERSVDEMSIMIPTKSPDAQYSVLPAFVQPLHHGIVTLDLNFRDGVNSGDNVKTERLLQVRVAPPCMKNGLRGPRTCLKQCRDETECRSNSQQRSRSSAPLAKVTFVVAILLAATFTPIPQPTLRTTSSAVGDTATSPTYESQLFVQSAFAMDDDVVSKGMSCVASKCSKQFASCISDKTCSNGMGCFVKCAALPHSQSDAEGSCQVRCMDLYQNELLDDFTDCTLTNNACYKALDVDERYPELPPRLWEERLYSYGKDARTELKNLFLGTWYISGGLNPAFDAFDCQKHIFHLPKMDGNAGDDIADATFEYRVKTDKAGGYFTKRGNKVLTYVQRTDKGVETSFTPSRKWGIDTFEADRSIGSNKVTSREGQVPMPPKLVLSLKPQIMNYADEWNVLASSSDPTSNNGYMVVAYRGSNSAWKGYGGLNVYTRRPVNLLELQVSANPRDIKMVQAIRDGLGKVGLEIGDLIQVDNSCT
mmetsp:Transcript_33455/g.72393  ORF Transcript_33455/g.72393 Transcript_33455/m.72393 type:complete len:488 (+) Transcript_33455:39-1502(+)